MTGEPVATRNADILVNGRTVRLCSQRHLPATRPGRIILAIMLFVLVLAIPRLAFGLFFDGWVQDTIQKALDILNSDVVIDKLTRPWKYMMGGENSVDGLWSVAYNLTSSKSAGVNVAVRSLASTLFIGIILMRLYKISQRMDANAQMPALKEVLQLFVFCAIWVYLINHALDIMSAGVDFSNVISTAINEAVSNNAARQPISLEKFSSTWLSFSLPNLIIAVFFELGAFISSLGIQVQAMIRAVQIYLYAMFSPIAFCFLGFDDTRQWGIGFFKGYLAVCLTGTILVFIVSAYPAVLNGIASAADGQADLLTTVAIVYGFSMLIAKAGSIARDILGG